MFHDTTTVIQISDIFAEFAESIHCAIVERNTQRRLVGKTRPRERVEFRRRHRLELARRGIFEHRTVASDLELALILQRKRHLGIAFPCAAKH